LEEEPYSLEERVRAYPRRTPYSLTLGQAYTFCNIYGFSISSVAHRLTPESERVYWANELVGDFEVCWTHYDGKFIKASVIQTHRQSGTRKVFSFRWEFNEEKFTNCSPSEILGCPGWWECDSTGIILNGQAFPSYSPKITNPSHELFYKQNYNCGSLHLQPIRDGLPQICQILCWDKS
jgi:hypothetical protein